MPDTKKIAVEDVFVYQDDQRKVECVWFCDDDYGLGLTNSDGEVRRLKLSKIAVEQIVKGFTKMLDPSEAEIKEQKFITAVVSDPPKFVWAVAKPD